MKKLTLTFAALTAATGFAFAQMSETTVTTTAPVQAAGTVTTLDPSGNTIIVDANGTPATYTYDKSTTWVDEAGNPVAMSVVRSGAPVTVYYSTVDGHMVASKMVVRKTSSTTTTTTTN